MVTRFLCGALIATLFAPAQKPAPPPAVQDLAAFTASLPKATVKPLDPASALLFSALPLTCVDDLQPRPTVTRPYFWQPTYRTVDAYDKTRAFYGCNDWPTAVSATWTLVTLLKKYPDLGSGQLIREKLGLHLGHENLDGELAYYKTAGNAQRPYGYAWFLRLYAELATWKDSDGAKYAENATPLARFFADGMVSYLVNLERPNRSASQANSALSLGLLLDYVDATKDMTIKRAVSDAARRFFLNDTACATETEAASPEVISPCLEEASVMSRVLDAAAFVPWFNQLLPAPQSPAFKPLLSISFDVVGGRGRGGGRGSGAGGGGRGAAPVPPATTATATQSTGVASASTPPAPAGAATSDPASAAGTGTGANGGRGTSTPLGTGGQSNARANWIGLAFTRADAYTRLAAALPTGDPRVVVFKRLADIHAESGQKEVVTTAAFDAPWVGALAVSYLTTNLATAGGAK